ncbi:hypothetical protein MKZ07_09650 [Paenibacillus sp. FSL P4-0338]|uniref:hypothetical protein n=1 Tax=unclassified Paenibacillus TaxID=185978 RepID=UPI0003E2056A|nr:hypothetical protein [Paenibacillus sp. FSL R7-269]ETT53693.1 hypothetical protein C162_06364 [Paenibacillus sp. FSL R7-269]
MEPWVYIVLVGAVAIVYALRLPARTGKEDSEKKSLKETEAALELYMADIEHENSELLKLVGSIKTQSQSNKVALQEEIGVLREQVGELQRSLLLMDTRLTAEEKGLLQLAATFSREASSGHTEKPQNMEQAAAAVPPAKPRPVSSIKLRYPRLFELHEQGKSIDSIAKTAGLQRGEVQLILQLAQQEESV